MTSERRAVQFYQADVFTDVPFGGNPVAVIPDAAGLTDLELEWIFDAFFTTRPGGMGMGLAICRSLVQAHGGHIWAVSTPGVGTTVHFTLPAGGDP